MSEQVAARQPAPRPATAATGILQRKCACGKHTTDQHGECTECRKKRTALQRRAVNPRGPDIAPPIVHEVLRSAGRPLDPTTRAFMEPRFGRDFSGVRVHTNERAAESAQAVNALAYTVGQDVVFGAGQYAPDTLAGKRLLAHELTHTVQQGFAPFQPVHGLQVGPPNSAYERTAEANEQSFIDGNLLMGKRRQSSPGNTLQRDEKAPIESERSNATTLQLDLNLIRLGLETLRGEHRLSAQATLTNPVSIPLDLLGINPGVDSSLLSAILSYDNRCNRSFQSALVALEAGPFIEVDRVPWRIDTRVGVRIGSLRFDPGVGLGFEGNDFDSVLFTLNLAAASTKIPPECVVPRPPRRPHGPDENPDKTKTPEPPKPPKEGDISEPPPTDTPTTAGQLTYTLHFFYDSTLMLPESHDIYQRVVELLQNVPSLHVQLTGHTSLEGTEPYNQRLSKQRAEAIRDRIWLAGISLTRLHTLGVGESAPMVTEPAIPRRSLHPSVESVRTLNRRVEATFFDPTGRFGPQFPPLTLRTPGPAPSLSSLGAPELQLGR